MVYEPLHHKYRPQTFGDLVGQDAIAKTLINAILSRRIAPAYLLTGPRGTGKTSSARILAKSLNCLSSGVPTPTPCGQCEVCRAIASGSALDVLEIDAASNTGVDNIREIIERSQFAPVQCRYKVYVIDECLTGDSLVSTNHGLMRIDDPALKGKEVLSYNESSRTWEYKKVLKWLERGVKPTLKIKTTHQEIRCTDNHLIRTEQGWIEAKNIQEGMKVLSPEVPVSNFTQKVFLNQKINLLLSGLQNWDILQPQSHTLESPQVKHIITRQWESEQQENGYQICSNIRFPQWLTGLEKVESVTIAESEKVYDIEVEDNHNFVANNLLVHNCHMLSTAAFNALLKTLEEPPDRVIFVLATTDPQRVLPTIISRCQRFDYRRIPLQDMVDHLSKIAHQENIDIAPEAITLVAQIANGGLRDAESLLDQLSLLAGTITPEKVWELVGAVPEQELLTLLQAIHSSHPESIIDRCRHLMNRGREPLIVLQNLAGFYLNLLIAKTAPHRPDLVAVTAPAWQALCTEATQWDLQEILRGQQHLKDSESQLKNTTQPRLWLEVTLLGLLPQVRLTPVVPSQPKSEPPPIQSTIEPPPTPVPTVEPIEREAEAIATSTPPHLNLEQIWQQVLKVVPMTTQSLLKEHGCLVSFDGSVADISIVNEPLLKAARSRVTNVEEAFTKVCRQSVKVNLFVAPSTPPIKDAASPQPQEPPRISEPASQDNASTGQPKLKIEKSPLPSALQPSSTVVAPKSERSVPPKETIDLQVPLQNGGQDNSSNTEIHSAAQSLARFFEGEIVVMDRVTEDEETENEDPTTVTIDELPRPLVSGRPDVIELADDEDIAFRRPKQHRTIGYGHLDDPWEVQPNSYTRGWQGS